MNLAAIAHSTDLAHLEGIVERGRQTFMEVGLALARIRDARLWAGKYENFDAYCKDRWGWGSNYASKLMRASEVAVTLRDAGTIVPVETESQARELAKAGTPEEQADVWQEAVTRSRGQVPTAATVRNVVEERKAKLSPREALTSSESVEWYTPPEYTAAAREVMGAIDLDPASCAEANEWIGAARFLTEADDGLSRQWSGRVWLNPPYGRDDSHRSNQEKWSAKLIQEHASGRVKQAHLLVNSATGNRWFQPLWAYPICFVDHRIKFRVPDGAKRDQPLHSNVIVYMGLYREKFARAFAGLGRIVVPGEVASVSLGGVA